METISHRYLFERWCPGAVIGSLFRHHIHLTGLIYSVISIWSIILAIVNQALKPLRYSLQLENPYTSASTPPRVTVHEPDPRFGFGNRQLATSACFIGSWRFYLTSGWGLLMYPAYTRVCLIYYYPFLVKEEREECRECRQIRKFPGEFPQKSFPKCLHCLHYLHWLRVRDGLPVGYLAIAFR